MAYTPENNPYIPGDPYSYDLKWIVEKLKEAISLYEPLNTKFDSLYDYVHDYFDNLDLTTEVQAIINQMEADGYFNTLINQIVTDSGTIESTTTAWLAANVTPVGSAVVVDSSLSIAGAAADAAVSGQYFKNIKYNKDPHAYLYKENTYINSSLVDTALNGYDTYKIDLEPFSALRFGNHTTPFYSGLTASYVVTLEIAGVRSRPGLNPYYEHIWFTESDGIDFVAANTTASPISLYITAVQNSGSAVDILDGRTYFKNGDRTCANDLTPLIMTGVYFNGTVFSNLAGYQMAIYHVEPGDRILIPYDAGLSTPMRFFNSNGQLAIKKNDFTATESGLLITTNKAGVSNLLTSEFGYATSYKGLAAVAFGTSLTQRATSYRTYLEELSGMTIDNQGISSADSATIKAQLLAYSAWSDKRVCIIEGFVNDWSLSIPLATLQANINDMIDGVYTAAPYINLFGILDHYGKLTVSSQTANSLGLTQYDYHKAAEEAFLKRGIPVIREYEISRISELTPQYLDDQIHLNAIGALQSATAIWGEMQLQPINIMINP